VGVFIATLIARLYRDTGLAAVNRYSSMEAAYAAAHGQLAYYRALVAKGVLRWILDWSSLQAHVHEWKANLDGPQPLGFILSMEGADPILYPEQVHEWWEAGLRIIGPAHYGVSPYAHGTGTVGGLFPPGKPLLRAMEQCGFILDVTHLADQSFDEALDAFGGKVLASHHNCRALVPDQRQLSDEQIRRLIERGAVIGMALDAWMMHPNWIRGQTKPHEVGLKLEAILDHVDHVCQIAGNARHVALGTDLDGGFGIEQTPYDLDTIADLQRLPAMLKARGYSNDDVEAVMHGNWLRFFRDAWATMPSR
jgi:membrane dipeptidase